MGTGAQYLADGDGPESVLESSGVRNAEEFSGVGCLPEI